jgi:hypothetical protein
MFNGGLRSRINAISKRPLVPAVVLDVLGTRCTVKLSTRGAVLSNLAFNGKTPAKGDSVLVDYSRGTPIVLTSDTAENNSGPIEATGRPIITAQTSESSGMPETVRPRYGNVLYRGTWDEEVDYLENDVVIYENVFYLCIANNINENPTGQCFWIVFGGGATGGGTYTESATPPGDPSPGDEWLNTTIGVLFKYTTDTDSEQWVEFTGAGSGGSGGGGGGELYAEVTYDELVALISTSGLIPGQRYCITDFCTIYDQPDFDSGGSAKATVTTKTGDVEPIVVLAIDNSHLSTKADSTIYPNDQLRYDVSFSATEIMGEPAKGRIIERIDDFNNRTDYDHRTVLFKRYESSPGSTVFDSYKDNGNDYEEYKTFQTDTDAYSNSNYLGDYSLMSSLWDLDFLLSNNVFGVYSEQNVTGPYFDNNTFVRSAYINNFFSEMSNNLFGDYCGYNSFGTGALFNSNTVDVCRFVFNVIDAWVSHCTIASNVGSSFKSNHIIGNISYVDFSASTHVYRTYTTTILKRLDGTPKLTYINNSDELVVVDVST